MMKKFFQIIFLFLVVQNVELTGLPCFDDGQSVDYNWGTLLRGNRQYVRNRKFAKQRRATAGGQNPHFSILSCADSRVTPEFVFSQGIGELFVVRSAGQVTDPVVIDSLEFSVRTFDVHTLVVLGHTNCGAVEGALNRLRKNGGVIDVVTGHLNAVLVPIETAIVAAGIDIYAPNAIELSLRANVIYIMNQLVTESPKIAQLVASKKVRIIGAINDIATGKVEQISVIE